MRYPHCSLLQVGTTEEFKLYKMLENERKDRGGGRIILNTQLSAFINLDWESEEKHKKACLYGRITLASVKKNKSASLLVAILPKTGHYSTESRQLLEQYGARVISGDLPQDFDVVQDELVHALCEGLKPTLQTKRLINDGENLLARLVKDGLLDDDPWYESADAFCIHHEIALDAVIKVEASGRVTPRSSAARHSVEELMDYAKKARFDVLVTTSLPQGEPVLALEFDGEEFHGTAKGRRRDAKKNELCSLSHLPLIRVGFTELPARNDLSFTDEAKRLSREEKRKLFRQLISYVTRIISFGKRSEIDREKSFIDLEDHLDWEIEFGDSLERDNMERLNYETYIRKKVAEKNGVLSEILYDSGQDGLTVSALVSDVISGNLVTTIASPRFYLSVIGRELHSIDKMMKSFALYWLHQKLVSAGVCTC